jgi:hypothetical protein
MKRKNTSKNEQLILGNGMCEADASPFRIVIHKGFLGTCVQPRRGRKCTENDVRNILVHYRTNKSNAAGCPKACTHGRKNCGE